VSEKEQGKEEEGREEGKGGVTLKSKSGSRASGSGKTAKTLCTRNTPPNSR
jgi:hypothetical protein